MTSKLTRDIIQSEIADFFAGVVEINTELGGPNTVEEAQSQLTERVLACVPEVDSEPVAYMTYKGYLLHAGDPKLAEYSEPMPLYADPRLEPESAEPVAYMYDGEDGREYNGHNEFSGGGKGVPLYRHAQPPSVPDRSIFEKWWESQNGAPLDGWDSLRTIDGYCDDGIDGQFEAWSAAMLAAAPQEVNHG